jgi:predicted RNA-binding protein associated with RNAse of E/G family
MTKNRIFYRKEKLRGACWEYQIDGGWLDVADHGLDRRVLHHRFSFYRPREVEVHTADGAVTLTRWGAEQWFFPDRWFSLLRFVTEADATVGYYVNFSQPLRELKANYYQDLDLELDLWLHPNGEQTVLDRDEFNQEIACDRLQPAWADAVTMALNEVSAAVESSLREFGPDLDAHRNPANGLPVFILRA